jgi:hypothetical protein
MRDGVTLVSRRQSAGAVTVALNPDEQGRFAELSGRCGRLTEDEAREWQLGQAACWHRHLFGPDA